MDFGDIGLEATEARTESLIAATRAAAHAQEIARKAAVNTGICRNPLCGLEVKEGFCSPDCRDEFDRINKLKMRT
jgi:hypothetical protein